jgi:hypothetical protein
MIASLSPRATWPPRVPAHGETRRNGFTLADSEIELPELDEACVVFADAFLRAVAT